MSSKLSRLAINDDCIDPSRVLAFFDHEATIHQDEALFLWMRDHPFDDLVVLDITASDLLAKSYLDFASYGFHLISANKILGALASDDYPQIRDAFAKTDRYWLYNATVGAGLPINYTVRDLKESGHNIFSISGVFSGT
ncbi:Bifunctional aspartokinase/homoserine dehydrogenase 2 [Arsenophonus endosymbiont of Bemisia tabaci Q2]|nr:Bifunctional aspartokinase/homoserine dehydrogenase 2 [Arsenophonus endosymbiont of Bemisia tabaci Q2]